MRLATLILMAVAVLLLIRIAWAQLDAPPSEATVQTAIARTVQALPASREATVEAIGTAINTGLDP
jgi:hypothetical protein